MIGINFLPWRQRQRENNKKKFILMIVSAVLLGLFVTIVTHTLIARKTLKQEDLNHYLNLELKETKVKLEKIKHLKLQKNKLLKRIESFRNLKTNSYIIVNVYDDLSKILPAGMYLTKLIKNENTVRLNGFADSSLTITRFMKSINKSKWLNNLEVNEIRTNHENRRFQKSFMMSIKIKSHVENTM